MPEYINLSNTELEKFCYAEMGSIPESSPKATKGTMLSWQCPKCQVSFSDGSLQSVTRWLLPRSKEFGAFSGPKIICQICSIEYLFTETGIAFDEASE